jgi:predicted DNA binding CopG/RHH family protein
MNANSNTDPLYDHLKDMDFEDAKPVAEVPALKRLQAERGGKSRITIRVDNRTLAAFKARAAMTDSNYQTLMNEALAQFVQGQTLADVVRDTIRATLQKTELR